MSDETEKKTFKSVLSPHVAEFVPAFAKKKSQDDTPSSSQPSQEEKPSRTNYSSYNSKAGHGEKNGISTKNLNSDINYQGPRKGCGRGRERDNKYGPSNSWRQYRLDHSTSRYSHLRQHGDASNTDTNNWRSRKNEETNDQDFKFSQMRGKSGKMENDWETGDAANRIRRNLNVETSVKSKLEQGENSTAAHHGDTPKGIHRGFGRGRGRVRSVWTQDQTDRNEKDFQTLRLHDYNQGTKSGSHNHEYCHSKASHGNKLKYPDSEIRVGSQKQEMKDLDHEFTKGKNPKRAGQNEMEEDGWIRISDKKPPNKALGIGHKESKEKTPNDISNTDDTNVPTQKLENQASIKRGWKKQRESIRKDAQNKEGSKISKSDTFTEPNNLADKNNKEHPGISTALQHKYPHITQTQKSDPNVRHNEIRILKKDDNFSTVADKNSSESQTFELVDDDDEFPDLKNVRQTRQKTSESSSLASDWLSGGNRMPIISYSAALKTIPKPQPRPSNKPSTKDNTQPKANGKAEDVGESKTKRKRRNKKKPKEKNKDEDKQEQAVQQLPKKTQQPLQLDLGDWLSSLQKSPTKSKADKQASKKVAIATGVLQMKLQEKPDTVARATESTQTSTAKLASKKAQGLHNMLDSTAPLVKRGKEREIPKKKKPSQLKKIILKEREEKKKALESGNQDDDKKEEISEEAGDSLTQEETAPSSAANKGHHDDDITSLPSTDEIIVNSSKDDEQSPAFPSEDDVKAQIHSRRFREYCDNVMDKELNKTTIELLQKLVMFQDRQYHKDPVKCKARRRYVVGLREVTKHLKLKKIKLVIISPNVERIKSAGGLDDTLHNIITIAHQNGVPVVFALRRQILGRVLYKKVPVSAIGVFYYDGAQDQFKELMDLTEKARTVYAERWKRAYDELIERIKKEKESELSVDPSSENQIEGESQNPKLDENQGLEGDDSSSGEDESEETDILEKNGSGRDIVNENNGISVEADINIEDL